MKVGRLPGDGHRPGRAQQSSAEDLAAKGEQSEDVRKDIDSRQRGSSGWAASIWRFGHVIRLFSHGLSRPVSLSNQVMTVLKATLPLLLMTSLAIGGTSVAKVPTPRVPAKTLKAFAPKTFL